MLMCGFDQLLISRTFGGNALIRLQCIYVAADGQGIGVLYSETVSGHDSELTVGSLDLAQAIVFIFL